MADETEVVYSYVGDVSSLREATKEAISLLDRYDSTLKRMAASPDFGASKTATTGFKRSISGMINQVNSLTKSINTAGASVDASIPDGAALVGDVTKDLADVLSFLDSSTKVTSGDLKLLTQIMQEAKVSIASVTARAQLLGNSMKSLEQIDVAQSIDAVSESAKKLEQVNVAQSMDKISASVEKAEKHYDRAAQAGFRIQEAYQLANKSAAESAAVFIRAGQSAEKLTGVQAVVQRIRTEMQLLGTQAAMAWQRFASYIDPTGDKIRSLQSKTSTALGKMKSVIAKVSSAFRRNTTEADDNSNSYGNLNNRAKSLLSTLSSIGSRARSTSGHFDILTNSVKTLNRAFYALVGVNIGRWLADSVKQSISYIENLNLFSVATGEAYEESLKFVNSMSELYGMDPSNLMRYAGNFYQLADAISMPDKASAALSLGLTKATNDIASLFNVDIETVFENLSSGMQGMSRAVRKYGMDIRTTTLQQTALSLGLTEQVENMSEANRQGLRFITMMQQANNASGDFARTIESPANQLRIFKEQVTQLGRAIGNFLIKPLTTAISYINGFVMALRMILQFIGSVIGVVNSFFGGHGVDSTEKTLDNVASGVDGVGGAAKEATKELKKMLAPFDELNLLQAPEPDLGGAGGGGGDLGDLGALDPAILKAIEEMQWKLDEVEMKAVKVRNAILAFLGFKVEDGTILSWDADVLEQNLLNKFPQWTKTIQAVFDNWSSIVDGFKAVFVSMCDVVKAAWENSINFIKQFINDDSASSFISNLGTSLQKLADWISQNASGIANFILAFGALSKLTPLVSIIANIVSHLSGLSGLLPSLATAFSSISATTLGWVAALAAVGVALVDQWNSNEAFRNRVTEVWNTIWSTLSTIIGQIIQLISSLWNDILQPLLNWLISALGPSIGNLVATILEVVAWMVNNLGGLISGLLQTIQGIIDFVAGVFTGNWARAWQGIVDVFAGLFNAVGSIVVAVMNAVISIINVAISTIYSAVVTVINLVLEAVNAIAGALGFTLELGISAQAPQIPYFSAPQVAMATGGVVTSPTNALIGEGRYDEAVMPLGNSPQMRQFADSVADRVNNGEQIRLLRDQNELLRQILEKSGTYLDGKLISDTVTRYQKQRSKAMGV